MTGRRDVREQLLAAEVLPSSDALPSGGGDGAAWQAVRHAAAGIAMAPSHVLRF